MLFKPSEIAKRFNIPYKTVWNWSKCKKITDWRFIHYRELEKILAEELAEQAKGL